MGSKQEEGTITCCGVGLQRPQQTILLTTSQESRVVQYYCHIIIFQTKNFSSKLRYISSSFNQGAVKWRRQYWGEER